MGVNSGALEGLIIPVPLVARSSKNDKFLSILKMLYFRWCRRLEGLVYGVTE
jgi:hypothetical protein